MPFAFSSKIWTAGDGPFCALLTIIGIVVAPLLLRSNSWLGTRLGDDLDAIGLPGRLRTNYQTSQQCVRQYVSPVLGIPRLRETRSAYVTSRPQERDEGTLDHIFVNSNTPYLL